MATIKARYYNQNLIRVHEKTAPCDQPHMADVCSRLIYMAHKGMENKGINPADVAPCTEEYRRIFDLTNCKEFYAWREHVSYWGKANRQP
jgi:hypothetical protein